MSEQTKTARPGVAWDSAVVPPGAAFQRDPAWRGPAASAASAAFTPAGREGETSHLESYRSPPTPDAPAAAYQLPPATYQLPPAGELQPGDVTQKARFTCRGVEYTVDADALDDLLVVEDLEGERIASALRRVLGDKQYTAFKESLRTADGRHRVGEAAEEIMTALVRAVDPTGASRRS